MNPLNSEAILQQHDAHVEAYHLHKSLEQARYLDYYVNLDRNFRDGMGWHDAHKQARLNMPENFK